MHTIKTPNIFYRLRSAVFGFAVAGLFCAYSPQAIQAQRAGSTSNNQGHGIMEKIDAEEGARRIASFRAQRLEGDFCFKFQLQHKPRQGKTVRYDGVMFGSWNERGPVSRFQLYPEQVRRGVVADKASPIELIVQNGVSPEVWMRHSSDVPFELIDDTKLFEPIFEGVLYTPFDLQMPFVFWNDYTYEGPARVLSRKGQRFLMLPPVDSLEAAHGISGVRIALDDAYYALLQVDVFGADEVLRSSFSVRNLKKVQGQYIVKEISLEDTLSADSTSFQVTAASVGLLFKSAVFDPASDEPAPSISDALFDVL